MTKKVLFIFPNDEDAPLIPAGISILSGIARSLSWDVDLFDTYCYRKNTGSFTDDRENIGIYRPSNWLSSIKYKPFDDLVTDLQTKINTFEPSIIAISATSLEYEFFLSFWPNVIVPKETLVIFGGYHAIVAPDEVINTGLFDLVCTGEGENVFGEVLTKYEKRESLKKIGTTYFRDKENGEIHKNPKAKLINENELWQRMPDYSLFEGYFLQPGFDGKLTKRCRIEAGRGCPYSCTYCANEALQNTYGGLGKFVRIRPIESLKKHIRELHDTYDIELFTFQDECFLSRSIEWLEELAVWYGKEIKKSFAINTRPETVTEKKIAILKKMNAPVIQIGVGVESGSEKMLKLLNRKMKISKIIETFDMLHKHNIRTLSPFMIGLPYETREDIFKSIELARRIKSTIAVVNIFQPMPGQKLREICIKEGFMKGNEKMCRYSAGSVLNMPQITAEEIKNLSRVFPLYVKLPKEYYSQIEKCEKDYYGNKKLHEELVRLRWGLGK